YSNASMHSQHKAIHGQKALRIFKAPTTQESLAVQQAGKRQVTQQLKYYNLMCLLFLQRLGQLKIQ
ncbi:MAG: hypothetical protein ACC707_17515, partial [Thiohalomonadales bacterium]